MVWKWRIATLAVTLCATLPVAGGAALAVGPAVTPAVSPAVSEECVSAKVATGMERPQAVAECLQEARQATTTVPASVAPTVATSGPTVTVPPTTSSASDGGDGTSIGLVAVVGLMGVAIGAVAGTLLARRRQAGPAVSHPTLVAPPPVAPPPITAAADTTGIAPHPDRAPGLVAGLIELSDRLPSQALRAEVMAMLARAGVQPIEVATGEVFDPTRMRGVGGAKAVDDLWVGRVATTERCGFRDGVAVVRQPEVIVYTAEG